MSAEPCNWLPRSEALRRFNDLAESPIVAVRAHRRVPMKRHLVPLLGLAFLLCLPMIARAPDKK